MKFKSRILALCLVSWSVSALIPRGCSPLTARDIDGIVKGIVFDQSGAVAPGTTIRAKDTSTGLTLLGKTDANGAFRVVIHGGGRYEVAAELPGFFRETYTFTVITARETSVDFLLRVEPTHGYGDVIFVGLKPGDPYRLGHLQGQVIGGFGRGIEHARIVARDETTGTEYDTKTREDGTFSIEGLPEGRYDVRAEAERHDPEHLTAVIEYAVDAALRFDLTGW